MERVPPFTSADTHTQHPNSIGRKGNKSTDLTERQSRITDDPAGKQWRITIRVPLRFRFGLHSTFNLWCRKLILLQFVENSLEKQQAWTKWLGIIYFWIWSWVARRHWRLPAQILLCTTRCYLQPPLRVIKLWLVHYLNDYSNSILLCQLYKN